MKAPAATQAIDRAGRSAKGAISRGGRARPGPAPARRLCLLLVATWITLAGAGRAADPVAAYQSRVDALARETRGRGEIRYRETLGCAYEPAGFAAAADAKAAYRDWLGAVAPVFARYDRLDEAVPVEFQARRVVIDGMTEAASYYVSNDNILVRTEENPGRSLLHESGHALQHGELVELGREATVSDRRLARFSVRRRQPRLDYLLRQAEFEIRLQDLNRFFAVFHSGSPIRTPSDAIAALGMLHAEVSGRDVERALAQRHIVWPASISRRALWQSPRDDAWTRSSFADAFTVRELLKLARERSEGLYLAVLSKVILEAPAHF